MAETEEDGADTMGTTTVVCEGDWGALLQYPASLGVKHVKERYGQRASSPSCAVSTKKAKKKKKIWKLNAGEQLENEYHCENTLVDKEKRQENLLHIREKLLTCYSKVIDAAGTYFPVRPSSTTNAGCDVDFSAMCDLASLATVSEDAPIFLKCDTYKQEQNDIFGRVISNICEQEIILTILGREFVIPARSTFLLSNLCQISPLYSYTASNGKYDLIVIDPPWENRSAIRGKKYNWLPTQRLLELSIPKLAAEGALVAVWVTNKRKLAIFIRQILFPKWNVHHIAEWHWLKLTTGGDLIHEMDSTHKKPYELVIIGRYMETSTGLCCSCDMTPPPKRICLKSCAISTIEHFSELTDEKEVKEPVPLSNCCAEHYRPANCCEEKKDYEETVQPDISEHFVFACVASQTHSQKPYLGDILDKYCIKHGRKLELFARNLLPGWTCWGNEVLLFQENIRTTEV